MYTYTISYSVLLLSVRNIRRIALTISASQEMLLVMFHGL